MISKDKIEEVRERANIVSVVSEYLPLTKRGANHIGLCPFHSEKTPSFSVNEEKRIYHCFGCNATGDAISFVMKKEGTTFPDALRTLARRYGVVMPEEKASSASVNDLIREALQTASEYFGKTLCSAAGRPAVEYLRKRGYEGEVLKRFGVGYAAAAWEGLAGYLKAKGVSADVAVKAGLIMAKEKGFYDRFRSRVIFPITDVRGRVIGFGGRSLDESEKGPKYLNSPESPVFKKAEALFGLHQARESIREKGSAIIVEGYFDLLALHKNGFTNSVATMGTALTQWHIRALKGYAGTVYALFDSDKAGREAAIRGLPMFIEEEMPCRAVLLPSGKDPDELLASSGADAMKGAIAKAEPLMEFYFAELCKRHDLKSPEGKARFFGAAVEYISRVRNVAEKGHYAAAAASILGLPASAVYEALKPQADAKGKPSMAAKSPSAIKSTRLKELTILKVILKHPGLYSEKIDKALEVFTDPALQRAGMLITSFCRAGRALDPPAMLDEVEDDEMRGGLAGLLFKEDEGFIERPEKMLEDSLESLLNKGRIKAATSELIRMAEDKGLSTEVASDIKRRIRAAKPEKE